MAGLLPSHLVDTNLNNMHNHNSEQTQKSNSSSVLLEMLAKKAELEAKLQEMKGESGIELTEPTPTPSDAELIATAKASNPVLQYLAQTRELPTLPEVTVEDVPKTLTQNELGSTWDNWSPEAAIAQLNALGFSHGDRVYIRLMPGKGIPESYMAKNWFARAKDFYLELDGFGEHKLVPYVWQETGEYKPDGTPKRVTVPDDSKAVNSVNWWRELAKLNLKGYGVYLVPNKGGRANAEITHFQSAFFEVDDVPFKTQRQVIKDFADKTGIKPTIVLRARKGYHVYYRFVESDWKLPNWTEEVQLPTIYAMDSDPAIKNNARLMRLAGFHHVKWDGGLEFIPVQLLKCDPTRKYTRAEYRQAIDKYCGQPYDLKRSEILRGLKSKSNKQNFWFGDESLFPLPHQVKNCPAELFDEFYLRVTSYINLVVGYSKGDDVEPIDAWVLTPEELKAKYQKQRNYTALEFEDIDADVNWTLRWAQYLYGYNPYGRPGWITGQDPTYSESEEESHSLDSLHINADNGKFYNHSGSGASNKEIWAALKSRAFRINPEEEKFYKEVYRRAFAKTNAHLRKLKGEISKEEFLARGLNPELTEAEQLDKVISLAQYQDFKELKKEQEFKDYYNRLKIDRNRINAYHEVNERYLSDETYAKFPSIQECEQRGQMLGLKAAKGTGKSQRIKQCLKAAKANHWLTISVTPRVNLGVAQGVEWEIPFISEDGIDKFINGEDNAFSCCWDSLHKLHRKDYRNKPVLLVIDEIESGLEHLATSSTFKGKGTRAAVYTQFRRLIDQIYRHGGLIIGADADLSRISIDYVQDLAPRLPITVIENTHVIEKGEVTVFFGKDGNVKAEIMKEVEGGQKFICACDSKDDVKDLYDYAMKNVKESEKHRYWAIHADNVNEEFYQEVVKDFDAAIKKHEPQAALFSPTITVGVSIDTQYFRMGYASFKGSVTADVARQMVARNREILPWVIFADNLCDRKGDDTPITPEDVKRKFVSQIRHQAELTSWMTEKLLREDQEKFSSDVEELEAQIRLVKTLTEDTRCIETAEFHLLGDVLAKHNFQKKYFHDCFVRGMESEGWKVVTKKGEKTGATEDLKEIREDRHKQESEEIASADHSNIPNADVAQAILEGATSREERNPAEKVILADKANLDPSELTAENVQTLKFQRNYFSGCKKEWFVRNQNVANRVTARHMTKVVKDLVEHEICCPQDAKGDAVWVNEVIRLGVFDIIDLDDDERDYKREDFQPVIDKIKSLSNKNLESWASKLDINWKAKTHKRDGIFKNPIGRIVKPILEKLGYDFVQVKKNKNGHNSYKIPAEQINDPLRAKILEGMDKKEAEKQAMKQLQETEALRLVQNEQQYSSVPEALQNAPVSEQVSA